jgi:hypothetical protein
MNGRRKNGLHGSGQRSVIGFSSFMGGKAGRAVLEGGIER